jgi:acetyl-CoA synthetase/acetyltransferase
VPAGRALVESEARTVLAAYGIAGPREALASSIDDAVVAAASLGLPVVLKVLVEGLLHKTEAGLVRVGLRSDAEVHAAAVDLTARATRTGCRLLGILVQEMVVPVAELLVGGRVDADFGPIVAVGGGGVLVEVYRDVAIRLAPIGDDEARVMLEETRAAVLLAGFRGRPAGDVAAAARVVAALSRFIADFKDEVGEVEINPLAVRAAGAGVAALDCLIVRTPTAP